MNLLPAIAIRALVAGCWAAAAALCLAANEAVAAAPSAATQTNTPANIAPPATRRLEEEELRSLLSAALHRQHADDKAEWELTLTRPWTPLVVPDEPLSAVILEPALNHITSTCVLRFDLRAGRKNLGSWQAQVQARLWHEVFVAHTPLRRGQLLSEADLTHERRDLLTLREPLSDLPAQASLYELAETVPAGSPLTARAIRLKPVLARGQIADAIIRDGAMMLSLKVEVLEEGVPGQVVRVRNPQSRREFRGKVLDEQTIAIPL
jgi:flagella basal body P-ring formation protein FlgA